jgi:aminoglycoside phosphotransferase (APT) family kinase protein
MSDDIALTEVRAQHKFDEKALQTYLGENLDLDFSTMELLQFEGGQSNPTFQLITPNKKYVLRKKPSGVLLKSAHAVDREYRVISALRDTPVPVPETFLLCQDESVIGTDFYLMEMVEGRILVDNTLPAFTPAQRTALTKDFIASLAALHGVDATSVGLDTFGKPGNYYARQIHRWSQQYIASETDKDPVMDALMAWLPDNIPADDDASIIHGDYRIPNCVVDPTEPKIAAVLDWELSTIGHPLADLAYWCAGEYLGETPYTEARGEQGFMSQEDVLHYYCQLTGRDQIEHWPFYLIFNLFRSAAIVQGVYKRGLDGNASSDHWQTMEALARASAQRGWQMVQEQT